MTIQAQQDVALMREALHEIREELKAARALAAERLALLERERAARASAERLNALKDEFLATVSHELRSPLSAITGWAHMLRRGASPDDLANGLEVIEQSAAVQAKLIDDLLDISRITSGQLRLELQTLEPRAFIDAAVEAIRPAAEEKHIRMTKVLDLTAEPVAGDSSRLQQVMVNLLSNAVKFTPEGGRVEVRLRGVEDEVEISVADSGIGIPPAFLPHVFDRFRQADSSIYPRFGGLGLGLAIVKHLVELHGGRVSAHSPGEGRGATFVLRLPAQASRREPEPARSPAGKERSANAGRRFVATAGQSEG